MAGSWTPGPGAGGFRERFYQNKPKWFHNGLDASLIKRLTKSFFCNLRFLTLIFFILVSKFHSMANWRCSDCGILPRDSLKFQV